jgi:hypothetical protein
VEQMCGRKKPKMLDRSLRGTNDLEVVIYNLKKEIDRLNEEVQAKEIYIKKLEHELDKSIRSDN